ncbi:gamma-glutamyltransferase [Pseudomonas sp. ICMP 460]|uniref:gamma-glutamyltransferase n=1 Tax=Pseudomonas sp. ICMP 460 TaxID=1718917 RepID=UPI0035327292
MIGHRSVGVPGTVAGMWESHKRFGKPKWAQLIQPDGNPGRLNNAKVRTAH